MKKSLLLVPVVAALAACSSSPKNEFDRRAWEEQRRQQESVERAVDKAPKWMTELPKANAAIYQNGDGASHDMGMAVNIATTKAFGKICMSAGGTVDQRSRVFIMDSGRASTQTNEMAIRSSCQGVDISGAEMVDSKMIANNGKFQAYVLIALPTGDANAVQKFRDEQSQRRLAETRSREAFRDLDRSEVRPAQ